MRGNEPAFGQIAERIEKEGAPVSFLARPDVQAVFSISSSDSGLVTFSPGSLLLEGATMANKDKGGSKSSKTAASKSLKEKRQAKKAKATRSGASSMGTSTNK